MLIGGVINAQKIDDYTKALEEIKETIGFKILVTEKISSNDGITVGFYNRHGSFLNPLRKFLINGHLPD